MPSPFQRVPLSFLARTGDGGKFPTTLTTGMDATLDHSHPDGVDAIRILSARLGLTTRQAEVLHWIAKGKTNEEIATILHCSFHTVKTHVKEIFQRLQVNNRAGAIGAAYSMFYELLRTHPASPERAIPKNDAAR